MLIVEQNRLECLYVASFVLSSKKLLSAVPQIIPKPDLICQGQIFNLFLPNCHYQRKASFIMLVAERHWSQIKLY
jgi:hypothetical protein